MLFRSPAQLNCATELLDRWMDRGHGKQPCLRGAGVEWTYERLQAEANALGAALRVRVHVRSFDAMCQMVAAGLGIAVLPLDAVRPHVKSMGLVQIDLVGDWVRRELLIGVRDPQSLSRSARLMLSHLAASAA